MVREAGGERAGGGSSTRNVSGRHGGRVNKGRKPSETCGRLEEGNLDPLSTLTGLIRATF